MLASIHKGLDKTVRQFIWGSPSTKMKIHLLSWKTLCMPKDEGGKGIRRSDDINKCLLAKVGWRILSCGEETRCKIMRAKYGIAEDTLPTFKHKQRETQIWKGIVWASDLLREGLRWTSSNGKIIGFWQDVWTGDERLAKLSLQRTEIENLGKTAREYWNDKYGWRWEEFSHVLPASVLIKLAGITLSLSGGHDRIRW